jgi:hypothetical protein
MKHLYVATFCDQLIPHEFLVKIGWSDIQDDDPFESQFKLGPHPDSKLAMVRVPQSRVIYR